MLYKHNNTEKLDMELFKNPTHEYRGTPFWSWTCDLDTNVLDRQIDYFKEMGLGGFQMHSRTGLNTKYLGEKFMDCVKHCVKRAKEVDMAAWLYDEDRWPSGYAGGLVTKDNKEFRERKLLFGDGIWCEVKDKETALKEAGAYYIATYDIELDENNCLKSYKRIGYNDKAEHMKRHAFSYCDNVNGWSNYAGYIDVFKKEAVDRFIELTHEKYKEAVGEEFGGVVPAIFFDEPAHADNDTLIYPDQPEGVAIAWSSDFEDTFLKTYGYDLLDKLPEIFWELPNNEISQTRYYFHEHMAERFATAFADNIADWCHKNNILCTGHYLLEENLEYHVKKTGDLMRMYRSMDIPGIDMLEMGVQSLCVIQARSVAHQYGREGVLSELYGATNWDLDFRGHKFLGDWQAALGVTTRILHLSYYSMAGECKRDFPASISYQMPWYKKYSLIEDHFARLNTVLTRGKPQVKVAVVYPIESWWVLYGPRVQTIDDQYAIGTHFFQTCDWLLRSHLDCDVLCEALLPELVKSAGNPLRVGEMEYDTIIVPNCTTLRSTTLDAFEKFRKAGGNLIFTGNIPEYVDAVPSDRCVKLAQNSVVIPHEKSKIIKSVEASRIVDIRNSNSDEAENLVYQLREDNNCKWLFIAHIEYEKNRDVPHAQSVVISVKGLYNVKVFDTLNGEINDIHFENKNGVTYIRTDLYLNDSLLLQLTEREGEINSDIAARNANVVKAIDIKTKVPFELEEPNMLLLDMAEYAFDDGDWQPLEEVLRIDTKFKAHLKYKNDGAQPWIFEDEPCEHTVKLKYIIDSECDIDNPELAYENMDEISISLNGESVSININGFYIDEAFKKIPLPPLHQGRNTLIIEKPFGKKSWIENGYLLGNFGVKVEGAVRTLTKQKASIGFSSITSQGMPYYGGNILYNCDIETNDCSLIITASMYRGALIEVFVDGVSAGNIIFAPYKLYVDNVKKGKHTITFKLYGNRYNTFAALHNADPSGWHADPTTWRHTGDAWTYGYNTMDIGILKSPIIEICE